MRIPIIRSVVLSIIGSILAWIEKPKRLIIKPIIALLFAPVTNLIATRIKGNAKKAHQIYIIIAYVGLLSISYSYLSVETDFDSCASEVLNERLKDIDIKKKKMKKDFEYFRK